MKIESFNNPEKKTNNSSNLSLKDLLDKIPKKWRDQPVDIIREMWANEDSIPIPVGNEEQIKRIEEINFRKQLVDKLEEFEKKFSVFKENSNSIEDNVHIINDFGFLITLNSTHLDKYAINEEGRLIIEEMLNRFNSKVFNGKSFGDFIGDETKKDPNFLKKEHVNAQLIEAIKQYIPYIESRLKFLKPESNFIKQFQKLKDKLD